MSRFGDRKFRPVIRGQRNRSKAIYKRCVSIADRVYVYDNSVDDVEARLLYRFTDDQLFKRYIDDVPEWALSILKE